MLSLLISIILFFSPPTTITPEPKVEIVPVNQTARVSCYVDKGIMANGKYVYDGAVAFSDRTVPLNTQLYLEGFGIMDIADRTALWVDEKYPVPTIDIWMNISREECLKWGVKYLSYTLINN